MTRYARLTGWGKYVPRRVLTNFDLEKMVDTSDEWIRTRTGIRERHIAAPGETCCTMSLASARQALQVAQLPASELDLIIVATSTPDYLLPATASMVQDQLGAGRAAAFNLGAGCTGWVYALVTACQFIQAGSYRNALVIGSEQLSMGIDWTDRNTCVLFGDGAGAVVLEASDQPTGLLSFQLGSDGSDYDALIYPGCGGVHPASQEVIDQRLNYLRMDGQRVFKFASRVLADSVTHVVSEAGLTPDDVALIIPHQANDRILELARRRLRLPPEKVMVNIERYGNTSAASIPIALVEAIDQGRLQAGDRIVFVGFGAGLTWAAAAFHWEPQEPAAIPAAGWPVRDRLTRPVSQVRTALWSTRVRLTSAVEPLLLPLYTFASGYRQRRRKQK
ncbi:MAG TPA: beta-ketoacyl-ACP synthase III [Anaerolineae bacterium]|nr:beta-ketoacyl-ACP synthase III [Anaerolineae bacterium]